MALFIIDTLHSKLIRTRETALKLFIPCGYGRHFAHTPYYNSLEIYAENFLNNIMNDVKENINTEIEDQKKQFLNLIKSIENLSKKNKNDNL
jgi:hypothetical protein